MMLGQHQMTSWDDFLSLWGSSVGTNSQSPPYLADTHKNEVNKLNAKRKRMNANKYGWRLPPGLFAADELDWQGRHQRDKRKPA